MAPEGFLSHEHSPSNAAEGKSLDLVQRVVVSVLVVFVLGTFAAVLAVYLVLRGAADLPQSSIVGLYVMAGLMGLVTAVAVLMINRRKPYHPLVLLGLLPLVSAFWIF